MQHEDKTASLIADNVGDTLNRAHSYAVFLQSYAEHAKDCAIDGELYGRSLAHRRF